MTGRRVAHLAALLAVLAAGLLATLAGAPAPAAAQGGPAPDAAPVGETTPRALAPRGGSRGRRVRVFAVGPRITPDWLESRATYRAKLLALLDRRLRDTPGTPVIQDGAGDVAAHLLGPEDPRRPVETARDLVVLPEDVGLLASFTGERGRAARAVTPDTGGVTAAIGATLAPYTPQLAYYQGRFPQLAGRGIPTRALALALTDTFARVAIETFAELADRHDAWLHAGVNMARSWHIVCRDRDTFVPPATGEPCAVEDPARVELLRGPEEPGRSYAYEATTDAPVNMGLVFDPEGRLRARQVKTYLTPVELPGQLDLVPGHVSEGVGAVPTPVGTIGIVTSKDAWMPDLMQRLDQHGVDVLLQPEFFVGDTLRPEGMWAADTLKSSGWADVLRHPSIEAMVLPEMTGNLVDFPADAQSHIVVEPRSRRGPRGSLAGQPSAPGFAAVAPYAVPDPVRAGETVAERRRRLGEAGVAMTATGGGPTCPSPRARGACVNGMTEDVIHHDLRVGREPRHRPVRRRRLGRTPFEVNRPVAPSRRPQRNVALAARGRRAWAVFEERRAGRARVRVVRSSDGGRTWSRPGRLPVSPGAEAWWPAVAAGPDGRVWAAWQERTGAGPWRVRVAATGRDGRRFGPARAVDAPDAGRAHQWKPAVASGRRGEAVVAWIDERRGTTGDDRLPAARPFVARVRPTGPAGPAREVPRPAPVDLARSLEHAWAPSLAARGDRVLLAWLDFRDYDWDVWSAASRDGGATWAEALQVNDTPSGTEALDDTPRATLLRDGRPLLAFTDWRKRDDGGRVAHPLYDVALGAPGTATRRADGTRGAHATAFAPALVATPDGGAVLAWQDHRSGPGDIRLRRVRRDGRPGRVVRVDDRGRARGGRWRPAVALAAGRVVVAWEDDRDGPRQVFASGLALRRLR